MNWNSRLSRLPAAALRLACLLGLALALALAPGAAFAGPTTGLRAQSAGPEYIIQPGDTFYVIAIRFGTTVDELVAANPDVNPNALTVGAPLVIPGYEGFSGNLKFHQIGPGETLESLARSLNTPTDELAQLNRLTNPKTVYLGEPIVFPEANAPDGPALSADRLHVLPAGSTLLEMAAAANLSPWALAEKNGLPGPALALGGLTLAAPRAEGDAAPGGLPAPLTSILVDPDIAIQGRTVEVSVQANGPVTLSGTLSQFGALPPPPEWSPYACLYPTRDLHFAQAGDRLVALQGMCALAPIGTYELSITAIDAAGNAATFSQLIPLIEGDYGQESLVVPTETLDPVTIQREVDAIRAVATGFTPQRMWDGLFQRPSEFGEYRSYFGTRRSYNDGPFDSFHGGLDFSGQVGTPVIAPAPGVVVLTEPNFVVYGGVTFIDHGWGVYTGYLHQSKIEVSVGQRVEPGQEIGQVGNTGRVTGPHLHWEIWVGGVTVDPLEWLERTIP